MNTKILLRLSTFLFAFFAIVQGVFAVSITPVRNEMNVDPGTSESAHVTIINDTDQEYYVEPVIEVFLKNDEKGYPIPAEFEESDIHNINNWIDISKEKILLPANGRSTVNFTVNVPKEAEPGGKYATIGFVSAKENSGAVTVKVQANSILLINVNGEVILDGNITSFDVPEAIYSDKGFNFKTNFENTGNTHIKPDGTITIKDKITGKFLEKIGIFYDIEADTKVISNAISVNINEGNVLPNSNRIFSTEWTDNIQEGEYTAYLSLNYKDGMQSIKKEVDFELKENLIVNDFNIDAQVNKADLVLTVTNLGNIHEKLIGVIEITNDFGYKVDELLIPEDIKYIKPNTTETFVFNWLDKNVPSGGYKATLKAKHGVTNTEITAEVSFGTGIAKITIIGIAIIILIIITAFVIKRRKKKNTNSNLF